MAERKSGDAIEAKVTATGASIRVSNDALTKIGQAANWLFPKQSAKAKITAALADRVAERILAGIALDDDDKYFLARLLDRQARALENAERTAEVVRRVLPESEDRMKILPPNDNSRGQPAALVSRAESIASEVLSDDIRELFARVVAGELCRPGSFSMRTLECIRSLDPNVANKFQRLCGYLVDGEFIYCQGEAADYLKAKGLENWQFELRDAGLLDSQTVDIQLKRDGQRIVLEYGGTHVVVQSPLNGNQSNGRLEPLCWLFLCRLSRIGKEIASVIPFSIDDEYLKVLIRDIPNVANALGLRGVSCIESK